MTDQQSTETSTPFASALAGLTMRGIGPAFMGGRIADIAIHPSKPSTWYLAVGSGGVWKTTNAGTTWTPVFDDQKSFSIGCVTVDPNQPDVVWVGTGEAVSGRHVAWGDGVYRSLNGGATWQHMGLARSEHIAEILVDPSDSSTVYVAAEGPLWSSGGDRGVFKTTNGGVSWEQVLQIDADTGVTSLALAPDDPDTLYAAAYQRRRRVWSFLGGGPGSGIYKTSNGGDSWREVTQGLPEGDKGKIGVAVTAAAPDTVYATIEADEETRGFYRSTDRGESWVKRNDYLSGGTGPHYYQELFASPTDPDRVYQVDVFVHWTPDGGQTIKRLETGKTKHSDNHLVWIDPDDGDHLLIGADAGLYETFDHGESFRHVPNLPISQFYRVAVDNTEPFYNILGGAQDLGTLFGPSRTTGVEGVRSQDWTVTLGADGYHVAFDPDDPAICYMEWQNGNMMRMDRRTMELQDIQPQGAIGDDPERWNWDCPIAISPHSPSTIYVASQRVWRSNDRGDSWTAISGDLTRNINRYELPVAPADEGGLVQSVDAMWDHMAMSMYSTITHLSESPVTPGVLVAGSDDGLVHVTNNGGASWRSSGALPEFPTDGFVNNVKTSQHDDAVIFVAADAHKNGDYTPYVFASSDQGASWHSIAGDLPEDTVVWSIEQDHVDPELLFIGAEYGVHVSVNGGQNWHKLAGAPPISFRDVVLHRQSEDLIGATFGRGLYVLDDYTALRHLNNDTLQAEAALLPVRDAWWYVPHQTAQSEGQVTLGSTAFAANNPDAGACFTYHLSTQALSAKKQRHEQEKAAVNDQSNITWPGWDVLRDEHNTTDPRILLVVLDAHGQTVRRLAAETKPGLHRITWDLRLPAPDPIQLEKPGFKDPWESDPKGPLVAPGTYSVQIVRIDATGSTSLTEPQPFFVKPTPAVAAQPDLAESAAFNHQVWQLHHAVLHATKELGDTRKQVKQQRAELVVSPSSTAEQLVALEATHAAIELQAMALLGDPAREKLREAQSPSIKVMVERIAGHLWDTTQAPTATQRTMLERASSEFDAYLAAVEVIDIG
ncbi:MAG: hypothetical protein ACI8XD_000818 [Thermoproteota archaeon]|jgi:hypothetical protein